MGWTEVPNKASGDVFTEAMWDTYIKDNHVPYNKLYDYVSPYGEKFREIGCTHCHIPVKDDAPKRAGKFPWEDSHKECGLHKDGRFHIYVTSGTGTWGPPMRIGSSSEIVAIRLR